MEMVMVRTKELVLVELVIAAGEHMEVLAVWVAQKHRLPHSFLA
jgi:hypothetical protein